MPAILQDHNCVCGRCRIKVNDNKFIAKGKKTEFILISQSNKSVDMFVIDDCVLKHKATEEKCDYLFRMTEDKIACFVECKGSDVLKAVTQINSTINILISELLDYTLKARIIPTRVYSPDIRTENYKRLRKKLNGNLITKSKVLTEII